MLDLQKYSEQQLEAELARRKEVGTKVAALKLKFHDDWPESPRGIWRVTTEGDCEGKSIRELGYYEGHVVDIAMVLAQQCYYSLRFIPIKPEIPRNVKPKEVHISLDMSSGTWDWDEPSRPTRMDEWLQLDSPSHAVVIAPGNYYASVKLVPIK